MGGAHIVLQITISKRAALIIAVTAALIVPATAVAQSLFTDVSDNSVHRPGIEYMKDSGVTLGCGDGTTFCPRDAVLREQMATFMYRLSGNDPNTEPSVIPASNMQVVTDISGDFTDSADWVDVNRATTTHVIPPGREGFIFVTFGGESVCENTLGYCSVRVLVNNQEIAPANDLDVAFDSPETAAAGQEPWESHTTQRVSGTLGPGTYTVKVQMRIDRIDATSKFRVDDWLLSSEVHYTG